MPSTNEPADVFKYISMLSDDECWPWLGPWGGRTRGEGRRAYFMAGGRRMIAHRWVYELMHGVTLTADQLIRHSCDNGNYPVGCCNPAHLSVGSNQDNMNDMTSHQRHGMPHHVVRAIRTLLERGRPQQEIADLYGVSRETISAIATQRVYRHVQD